jgi:hypothetical protein
VVAPFAFDAAHPYASGQHRGIDIGADAAGESVLAPASGTVSFAGVVPTSGTSLTIETADGYSVTLTHLGSIVVTKGAAVTEGEEVGTIGPSGTPETDGPYVHLGIRTTSDPNGYLDPLSLLPPVAKATASDGGSPATQPVATQPSAGSSSPPAPASESQPAPPATATTQASPPTGSIVRTTPAQASRQGRGSAETTHTDARSQSSKQSQVTQTLRIGKRAPHHPRLPHRHASAPMPASRRPVVEIAAPGEPTGLDAGQRVRLDAQIEHSEAQPQRRNTSSALLSLVCNGAAALVAASAAVAAARTRRRHRARRVTAAAVLQLPRPKLDRQMQRAA